MKKNTLLWRDGRVIPSDEFPELLERLGCTVTSGEREDSSVENPNFSDVLHRKWLSLAEKALKLGPDDPAHREILEQCEAAGDLSFQCSLIERDLALLSATLH